MNLLATLTADNELDSLADIGGAIVTVAIVAAIVGWVAFSMRRRRDPTFTDDDRLRWTINTAAAGVLLAAAVLVVTAIF